VTAHRAIAAIAVALAIGCAPPTPPKYVSIDTNFAPDERIIVADAITAWCDAGTGWCPEHITGFTERGRFIKDTRYARHGRPKWSGGFNDGDNVYISTDMLARVATEWGPEHVLPILWITAAHEAGHFGIEDHVGNADSLMNAAPDPGRALIIDAASVREWCEQQGDCP
jgi:hypothetical protein